MKGDDEIDSGGHRFSTNDFPGTGPARAVCGFNDLSYFNRIFRRRYGMTPSDAREEARKHGG
jgi:hypothetical protein